MSDKKLHEKINRREERERAKTRVSMYFGKQEHGHRLTISSVFKLIWQAKVFLHPQAVTVDLSPKQFIVRAECGPLIRPVQQVFSFGTGETLDETWEQEWRGYYEKISREDKEKFRQRDRYGWRYCFSGPIGPRLNSPTHPFILAHCGAWGLRTNDGLWCEAYQEGIPVGKPFLLKMPSSIGLFAAAALDPEWFTGLPFTEEDADRMTQASYRRYAGPSRSAPRPLWTPGEIIANWHPQDNLISDKMLTAEGLQTLL